jgi:hypothetical protein
MMHDHQFSMNSDAYGNLNAICYITKAWAEMSSESTSFFLSVLKCPIFPGQKKQ